MAAILAGGMMLEFLSLTDASASIESAVQRAIKNDLTSMEAGKMGMGNEGSRRPCSEIRCRVTILYLSRALFGHLSFLLRVFLFIPRSLAALDILCAGYLECSLDEDSSTCDRILEYTSSSSFTFDKQYLFSDTVKSEINK